MMDVPVAAVDLVGGVYPLRLGTFRRFLQQQQHVGSVQRGRRRSSVHGVYLAVTFN